MNTYPMLMTFSDFHTVLLHFLLVFQCPRQPILGVTPGLGFLGNPLAFSHWLEPTPRIAVSPPHSQRACQEFPRSEEPFVAADSACTLRRVTS